MFFQALTLDVSFKLMVAQSYKCSPPP